MAKRNKKNVIKNLSVNKELLKVTIEGLTIFQVDYLGIKWRDSNIVFILKNFYKFYP